MKKIAFDTMIVLDAICNRNDAEIARQLFMEVAEERAVGVQTRKVADSLQQLGRICILFFYWYYPYKMDKKACYSRSCII